MEGEGEYKFGVGFVIDNTIAQCIEDVIAISDRRMILKLRGTVPYRIFNVYAPQAGRNAEVKASFYNDFEYP